MLDDYRLMILAGKSAPLLLEDRQMQMDRWSRQVDCDEEHDMRLANAKVKRALVPGLVIVAVVFALWAYGLVNGDIGRSHLLTVLLNGVVVGCVVAAAPSLDLRRRIKKYYKLEREEIRADFGIGDSACN